MTLLLSLDVDIRAIETFGAVELTVKYLNKRKPLPFKRNKKMMLTFPVQTVPDDLEVSDKVPAWTFNFGSGKIIISVAINSNGKWRSMASHYYVSCFIYKTWSRYMEFFFNCLWG